MTSHSPFNKVVHTFNIDANDQIIAIRENLHSDANFILTHLIQHAFDTNSKVCLVLLHNTLGHYQNVGKKLGYDLLKKIEEGEAYTIDVLKELSDPSASSNDIDKHVYQRIQEVVSNTKGKFYVFIDDLSHFLDLGIGLIGVTQFINHCAGLDDTKVVINTHCANKEDVYLSNALHHISDLIIDVFSLKTGRSVDVTGVVSIRREGSDAVDAHFRQTIFHYRTLDREVKLFAPGDSILNL